MITAVEDAIYDKLYANAGILSAVGTRIYRGTGPDGGTYPLITYQLSGGGDKTDTPREKINVVYLLQGVSQISEADASALAGLIRTALHKVTLTITGWTNYWTAVEDHLQVVELTEGGATVWRAGLYLRVRACK